MPPEEDGEKKYTIVPFKLTLFVILTYISAPYILRILSIKVLKRSILFSLTSYLASLLP